jgi:hypothetical protein
MRKLQTVPPSPLVAWAMLPTNQADQGNKSKKRDVTNRKKNVIYFQQPLPQSWAGRERLSEIEAAGEPPHSSVNGPALFPHEAWKIPNAPRSVTTCVLCVVCHCACTVEGGEQLAEGHQPRLDALAVLHLCAGPE